MDNNEIIKDITDTLENYNNKENKNWITIQKEVLGLFNVLGTDKENIILIGVVKEITRRGYSIEDEPFRLEKFKY